MEIIETNLQFKIMDDRTKTEVIFLHHAAAISCTPEQIHQWHLNNGWSGAGYHFLIRKDGKIYRLRPENKIGAHSYGANSNSLGLCAEGDFTKEEMNSKQKDSIVELIKYLQEKYSNINEIKKHSDTNATACPGNKFPFDEIVSLSKQSNDDLNISKTEKITDIQKNLNEKYMLNISIDNIYGNETKKALTIGLQRELNLQFNKNLVEDGIFGPKTKDACINVSKGATGNITYLIQSMLICKGKNLEADGIFGEETEKEIKEFQKNNGLIVDGIVGKETFEKLFK